MQLVMHDKNLSICAVDYIIIIILFKYKLISLFALVLFMLLKTAGRKSL